MRFRFLIPCLVLWHLSFVIADEVSDAQLRQLQRQAERLAGELNQQRDTRTQNERALAQADRDIAANQRQIERLTQEQVELRRQLAGLERQEQELQEELELAEEEIIELLLTLYMQTRQPVLKMLLSQDGPELLSRSLVYFEYFNNQQQKLLRSYQAQLQQLEENQQQINSAQQRITGQRQELDAKGQRLSQQQQQRRQLQLELDNDISVKERRLAEVQQDSQRLQRLLQEMQRAAEREAASRRQQQGLPTTDARLPWPTQGRVLQSFGRPVEGNAQVQSDGVLIAAPQGQEVRAVQAGQVIFADYLRGYGMLIIVDHGQGWLSLYGRNDAVLVETGQSLDSGALIARVGRSGGFDQTALYFEVRHNGRPVDPVAMLARR